MGVSEIKFPNNSEIGGYANKKFVQLGLVTYQSKEVNK